MECVICQRGSIERWSKEDTNLLHNPMKRTYKVRRIFSTYRVIYLCIASTMATLEAKDSEDG